MFTLDKLIAALIKQVSERTKNTLVVTGGLNEYLDRYRWW